MPDPYTLIGCYIDQSPNRTLNITAYQGHDGNNASTCHDMCNVPQFKSAYFGLEYGTECYCGGSDAAIRFQPAGSPEECNKPCPNNASEMCGSDWRLSIYQILDTSIKPSPSPELTVPPLPTSSSTVPGDNGNGTTSTPPPSTTPGGDQQSTASGSHLTGGQIAGIGVAAFVIMALLAAFVMFLMRRRQQRGQKGRRLARPGTGTSAGPQSGAGAIEAGAEGGASGAQMAGASGATVGAGAGAGGGSNSNSREGGLASGKAKAAGGATASVDGDSLVAGAPYHHHPHNDELPGYQSSAR